MQIGLLVLDYQNRQIRLGDYCSALTPLEFYLLSYLLQNAGRVISPAELLQEVWQCCPETGGSNDQPKSAIKRLRKKIEPDPKRPVYLITVRGHGYRLITQEEWEQNSLMNSLASSES